MSVSRHLGAQFGHLLSELELFMFDRHQAFLQSLILLFYRHLLALELLDFLSFSLPGGLGGLSVSEDSFDASLFLFILGLGSFSEGGLVCRTSE